MWGEHSLDASSEPNSVPTASHQPCFEYVVHSHLETFTKSSRNPAAEHVKHIKHIKHIKTAGMMVWNVSADGHCDAKHTRHKEPPHRLNKSADGGTKRED